LNGVTAKGPLTLFGVAVMAAAAATWACLPSARRDWG